MAAAVISAGKQSTKEYLNSSRVTSSIPLLYFKHYNAPIIPSNWDVEHNQLIFYCTGSERLRIYWPLNPKALSTNRLGKWESEPLIGNFVAISPYIVGERQTFIIEPSLSEVINDELDLLAPPAHHTSLFPYVSSHISQQIPKYLAIVNEKQSKIPTWQYIQGEDQADHPFLARSQYPRIIRFR